MIFLTHTQKISFEFPICNSMIAQTDPRVTKQMYGFLVVTYTRSKSIKKKTFSLRA
jgi:hypothetical protein